MTFLPHFRCIKSALFSSFRSKMEPISFDTQSVGLSSVPLVRDRLSQPTPIVLCMMSVRLYVASNTAEKSAGLSDYCNISPFGPAKLLAKWTFGILGVQNNPKSHVFCQALALILKRNFNWSPRPWLKALFWIERPLVRVWNVQWNQLKISHSSTYLRHTTEIHQNNPVWHISLKQDGRASKNPIFGPF